MRSPIAIPALFLILAGAAMGCAPQSPPNPFSGGVSSLSEEFDPTKILPDEISREEIDSRGRNDLTAMALIRRLRPSWLTTRGQTSFVDGSASYPVVYIDEIRHGGLPTLHRIPASEILRMEFFSTADATTRWGTGHPSGVINIVTGRF